jgi:hypothetical protein
MSYVMEPIFLEKNAILSDRRSYIQPQQNAMTTSHDILVTDGSGNSQIQRLGIRKRSKSRGDITVPSRDADIDPLGFSATSEPAAV